MRMPYIIACGMLALAACAYTDPVLLRHPETGKTVQCGPYPTGGIQATAAAMHEARCLDDYQRQWYERVPK